MGLQENGNGEMGLSGVPLGSKNKYMRMDSEMSQMIEEDDASQSHHHQLSNSTKKYVFACAVFASLNSVLLGYGKNFSPFPPCCSIQVLG